MRIVFYMDRESSPQTDRLAVLRQWVAASGLPFVRAKATGGQPRVSYGPNLGKSLWAEREYADVYLWKSVSLAQAKDCLSSHIPPALHFIDAWRVPYTMPSVQSLAVAARYRVEGPFNQYRERGSFENFLQAASQQLTPAPQEQPKTMPDGVRCVCDAQTVSETSVRFTLVCTNGKWPSPWQVVYAWLGLEPSPEQEAQFLAVREGLFWQDSQLSLHLI